MWPVARGATQRIGPQTTNIAGGPRKTRKPDPAEPLGSGLTSGLGFETGKREQPVPGGVGRRMLSINPANDSEVTFPSALPSLQVLSLT